MGRPIYDEWTFLSVSVEFTVILGASWLILNFNPYFDEIPLRKQNSPRWDIHAFCCVTTGVMLFAYVPLKRTPGLYELL